jgi:phosphoribosylanthranilate isomerase
MKLKLCGVRRVEDALLCADAGAGEVGVIFAKSSKRCVSAETARAIRKALPPAVGLVGVFLDATRAELDEALAQVELSAVQLHGALPDSMPALPIYVALHVEGRHSLERIRELPFAARVLLDSPKGGGSGLAFPWALAQDARAFGPRELFIAGGLTPLNVKTAIRFAHPDGVDVASGIEAHDGYKGPDLIRAFVRAAKEATI